MKTKMFEYVSLTVFLLLTGYLSYAADGLRGLLILVLIVIAAFSLLYLQKKIQDNKIDEISKKIDS